MSGSSAQRMPPRMLEYAYEANMLPPPKDLHLLRGCEKAINTPELLEMILGQLPPTDIVRLRRTEKRFRHLIDTSIALKKRLFLLPSVDAETEHPICNPILLRQVTSGYGLLRSIVNPTTPLHPNDIRLLMLFSEKVHTAMTVRFKLAKHDSETGELYHGRSKVLEVQPGEDGVVRYADFEKTAQMLMVQRGEEWVIDYWRTELFI
ncbi:hypothetical protein M409DRAFT_22185 [Zasmidium cellare ATCC 36951]|uniref:F-box domain-containing protein n=1 Tax=Zasmidium cellare ATCC 36951 TaxID=1080233 RepID=A0A6A6CJF4_ZASCE|nr:uncharacterized protein M409DRAFT_22185 [Zasmidium cellare ATCC 36951]KAF2167374.1 hypothetical protein M409DRAFT_22185 [Zasmidium cellare ATCC 36951]